MRLHHKIFLKTIQWRRLILHCTKKVLTGVGILDGALLQQHLGHRAVIAQHGHVQRRQAVAVQTVDVHVGTLQDRPGLLQVAVLDRSKEG